MTIVEKLGGATRAGALLARVLRHGVRRFCDALDRVVDARRVALACMTMFATVSVAQAAQQCFSQAGTFGGLTVTQSGPGCGSFLTYEGFTNGLYMGDGNTTEACTFTLSPAVQGNTINIGLRAHSCNGTSFCEEVQFSLNGTHYAVAPADLVTPAGGFGEAVTINGAGDVVGGAFSSDGSGLVTFNSAPGSVSSITINHVVTLGAPAGTIYQVCADDAGGVGPGGTATVVVSSINPSLVGQSVTFTATVTGTTPTGSVQFKDGATDLGGPVALVGGTAALTTSALSAGSHPITAVYGGDADDATSTSPAVTQLVNVASAPAIQAIPTLTESLLAVLAAMVAVLGLVVVRRRS